LVYVDFENQQRVLKESAHWFKNFLTTPHKIVKQHSVLQK
jgi:hypothetical protein